MGRTITTHWLSDNDDNVNGIKRVWYETGQMECIYFTKAELSLAKKREELSKPALYFLLKEDKEVYIGETEKFKGRIADLNSKKDWDSVLVFTCGKNSLSKSEVRYLEMLAYNTVKQAANWSLTENKQKPPGSTLAEHKVDSTKKCFKEIQFLCDFLGYNMLKECNEKSVKIVRRKFPDFWYCEKKGVKAIALYYDTKMFVLEGSTVVKEVVKRYNDKNKREELIKNNAALDGKFYKLTKDIEFKSPSGASRFVLGKASNGWEDWKNDKGKTLDEVVRQNL